MKRLLSIFAAAALVGTVGVVAPASAQTTVPATVNIDDPFGDANTQSGDQVGPADLSSVGDIGKIWFSHTAESISVHFQTEGPPPASQGLVFQVYASPNDDFPAPQGCLRFITIVPGSVAPNYAGSQHVKLVDRCNDAGTSIYDNGVDGEALIEELGDGTGLITMTFPRSYSPLLADGAVITEPHGRTDIPVGGPPPTGFVSFRLDDTVLGTEYAISGGSSTDEPEDKEKPKKAKKDKPKKKKKKPKPPATPACAPYVPGEMGAEAEHIVVTDAATEETPLEFPIEVAEGLADAHITHVLRNIQVDTEAAEAGLYARVEFGFPRDIDTYLYFADGTEAAQAAGFNPAPVSAGPFNGNDNDEGGHTEEEAEQLDGVKTADCGGYTYDIASYITEPTEVTLKLWLGEITWDPANRPE